MNPNGALSFNVWSSEVDGLALFEKKGCARHDEKDGESPLCARSGTFTQDDPGVGADKLYLLKMEGCHGSLDGEAYSQPWVPEVFSDSTTDSGSPSCYS